MKIRIIAVMVAALVISASAFAEDKKEDKKSEFKTEKEKVSYSIGTSIGANFRMQEIDVDLDVMLRGIKDAIAEKEFAMTEEQMRETMMAFQKKMQEKMMAKREKEMKENAEKGKKFLEENKKKKGVVTLPSGLQYKVIKEGTGATQKDTAQVKTHHRGTLIDGTEFDSSYKRGKPAEFPVRGVIKGWTEALQLMKEGAKWELYIPSELAYGERGSAPNIGPNSALIFEIELIEVMKPEPPKAAPKPNEAPNKN